MPLLSDEGGSTTLANADEQEPITDSAYGTVAGDSERLHVLCVIVARAQNATRIQNSDSSSTLQNSESRPYENKTIGSRTFKGRDSESGSSNNGDSESLSSEDRTSGLPTAAEARFISTLPLETLVSAAGTIRDQREDPHIVTFSPKVFIPVTFLCRDSCAYCTFAKPPDQVRRAYMTEAEVLEVARAGAAVGCVEALFTLGDKPELRYEEARKELQELGFPSTLHYVAHLASRVLQCTGLLPHINAGTMGVADLVLLRHVAASQGLMLESTAESLLKPAGAHWGCPDKEPTARLATIEAAGEARVPFTSGLLVGIGETSEERLKDLLILRDLHARHGHIQEVIIQPFRAKGHTRMGGWEDAAAEELLWTVAMARIVLGADMSVQSPPNLSSGDLAQRALIAAGINDWGGISPLTVDWVNPEAPWPHIQELMSVTAASGKVLVPRLPVYPQFLSLHNQDKWLDPSVVPSALRLADSSGYARCQQWAPGTMLPLPSDARGILRNEGAVGDDAGSQPISAAATAAVVAGTAAGAVAPATAAAAGAATQQAQLPASQEKRLEERGGESIAIGADGLLTGTSRYAASGDVDASPSDEARRKNDVAQSSNDVGRASDDVACILDRVLEGRTLSEAGIVRLFAARGADFHAVCNAADELRAVVSGDEVSYVVNRNINYTNVCTYGCQFCAFSKGKSADSLRGQPYLMPLDEITCRAKEAWERGATEVCMQGGIHPDFTGDTYLSILSAVKAACPDMHVHAFSPLEVWHGATSLNCSVPHFLRLLKDAGLGSLPGTAAEILDDSVRAVLCPDKISTVQWVEVIEAAHAVGLPTTSTIMFGHVDHPVHWARHLLLLRATQERTGGITEFVPLPFVHMQAPMYLKGRCRRGPTFRECVLMHAVGRLVLHPHIRNIQASWVKMGVDGVFCLLAAGCNDVGGTLMNESITRAAGAVHGQEITPQRMEAIITAAGRLPRQRTTLYESAMPRFQNV
ncbi:hypothetical protein CLOM_g21713 [Closterium sp. NIES-68]|nr:hypothetical protein CLOM_g21713 [Closterium sp. NIES-68]